MYYRDIIDFVRSESTKKNKDGTPVLFQIAKILNNLKNNNIDYASARNTYVRYGDTNIVLKEMGANSFGTYSQIVKDLRLPTAANYQWTHVRQVETPIVGAIYNQYIIDYCAPATNEPLAVVGGRMDSHTTHVFWVKNDAALIKEWETALKTIGAVTDIDTKTEVVSPVVTEAKERAVNTNELTKGVTK